MRGPQRIDVIILINPMFPSLPREETDKCQPADEESSSTWSFYCTAFAEQPGFYTCGTPTAARHFVLHDQYSFRNLPSRMKQRRHHHQARSSMDSIIFSHVSRICGYGYEYVYQNPLFRNDVRLFNLPAASPVSELIGHLTWVSIQLKGTCCLL